MEWVPIFAQFTSFCCLQQIYTNIIKYHILGCIDPISTASIISSFWRSSMTWTLRIVNTSPADKWQSEASCPWRTMGSVLEVDRIWVYDGIWYQNVSNMITPNVMGIHLRRASHQYTICVRNIGVWKWPISMANVMNYWILEVSGYPHFLAMTIVTREAIKLINYQSSNLDHQGQGTYCSSPSRESRIRMVFGAS